MAKRLPYKATEQIDQAVMSNEMAINDLVTILETPGISESETFRRVGLAINKLHKLTTELKLIPIELKEEKQNALTVESQSAENE